jgi:hypothetical protein
MLHVRYTSHLGMLHLQVRAECEVGVRGAVSLKSM